MRVRVAPAHQGFVKARLLGCEVVLGVSGEAFWSGSCDAAHTFIADGPKRFWRLVEELFAQAGFEGVCARCSETPLPMNVKLAPVLAWLPGLSGLTSSRRL